MKTRQQSIAIIGGGCAGWFVAAELAQRCISSTVIDVDPPGAFASTRNQGWLQSGALYAAMRLDDIPTAQFCREGYQLIRSRYPGCIRMHIPCYFLFYHEEELQTVVRRCQDQGIEAHPISICEVKGREPILRNSRLAYAAEVPDIPFDSSRLLQEVVNHACKSGVQFHAVSCLEVIRPVWDGDLWHLFLDHDQEITCKAIVVTCGVYIPEMLERLIPGQRTDFKRTKTSVLVLQGEVANSMLITPREPHGPYLVPFGGAGMSGATICLSRTDEDITDHLDHTLPAHSLEKYAESLSDFYPGIETMVSHGKLIQAHFYTCQKLYVQDDFNKNHSNRRPFCLSYAPQPNAQKNIFIVYPGKFTAAPIAAQTCVEELEQCLGNLRGSGSEQETGIPAIARQKYYTNPQYVLRVKNGRLIFDPLI